MQALSKKAVAANNGLQRRGAEANTFLGQRLSTDDGLVHLAPPLLLEQAQQLDKFFDAEQQSQANNELRLISKRAHSTHNSWTQNIAELTNGERGQTNFVYMHPDDANVRQLADKDIADIQSSTGKIRLPVKLLPELMPGTVAVSSWLGTSTRQRVIGCQQYWRCQCEHFSRRWTRQRRSHFWHGTFDWNSSHSKHRRWESGQP